MSDFQSKDGEKPSYIVYIIDKIRGVTPEYWSYVIKKHEAPMWLSYAFQKGPLRFYLVRI